MTKRFTQLRADVVLEEATERETPSPRDGSVPGPSPSPSPRGSDAGSTRSSSCGSPQPRSTSRTSSRQRVRSRANSCMGVLCAQNLMLPRGAWHSYSSTLSPASLLWSRFSDR